MDEVCGQLLDTNLFDCKISRLRVFFEKKVSSFNPVGRQNAHVRDLDSWESGCVIS